MGTPTLAKIEPIVTRKTPPEGARIVGQREGDGEPIYEITTNRGRSEPVIDPESKQQVWELHPTTAKPLYPRYRRVSDPKTYRFTLHDAGNGNVREEPYVEPSQEERAALERERKIAEVQRRFAEAVVDGNVSPDDFIGALKQPKKGAKD